MDTMGAKMITHTHIFIVWELIPNCTGHLLNSVTHGFLAGTILRNSGAYEGTFWERANYTSINLGCCGNSLCHRPLNGPS